MSSAACFTNKVKVIAQAKNTKVEYPGNVGSNSDPLKATIGCSPNFSVQVYTPLPACARRRGIFRYQINCFPN